MSDQKIEVSLPALHRLLSALNGPDHMVMELKYTRLLPDNPIDILIGELNEHIKKLNTEGTT